MGKTEQIVSLIIFNLFFLFFIVAIFIFIQQYRIKKREHLAVIYRQNIEHQKELLSTQLEIQNQTMQHIGREIHDNIGQKLTLASLYTQQLVFENKAPQISRNIENISNIINSSLSELRQLSKSLTDNSIENKNLVSLLKSECRKINEFRTCEFNFSKDTNKIQCSYETKSFIVRIVQEFLQNSIKHANCSKMVVDLSKDDFYLKLCLKDDGIGFDTQKINSGIGLVNMKKRTELLEGLFLLESDTNGTNVTIKIPI
jgi:signal transduction histidine kinase